MEPLKIVYAERLSELNDSEWNSLTRGQPGAGLEWLKLVQETALVQHHFQFLLGYRGNELVGGLCFREQGPDEPGVSLDDKVFGRGKGLLNRLGLCLRPVWLLVAPRQSAPSLFGPPEVVDLLLAELERRAQEGFVGLACSCVPPALESTLRSRRYLQTPEFPSCRLRVSWTDFAAYVRWLRQSHPRTAKNIPNERNRGRKAGIQLSRLDQPELHAERLHQLADSHWRRLNAQPFPYTESFFRNLKTYLGDSAQVEVALHNGGIVGFQLRVCRDGNGFFPAFGIHSEYAGISSIYANLGYNNAIEKAIADGVQTLNFGILVYESKIRRGCELSDASLFLRPRTVVQRLLLWPILFLRRRIMWAKRQRIRGF
jgi:hypothetical protein